MRAGRSRAAGPRAPAHRRAPASCSRSWPRRFLRRHEARSTMSEETVRNLRARHGLDRPLPERYARGWLARPGVSASRSLRPAGARPCSGSRAELAPDERRRDRGRLALGSRSASGGRARAGAARHLFASATAVLLALRTRGRPRAAADGGRSGWFPAGGMISLGHEQMTAFGRAADWPATSPARAALVAGILPCERHVRSAVAARFERRSCGSRAPRACPRHACFPACAAGGRQSPVVAVRSLAGWPRQHVAACRGRVGCPASALMWRRSSPATSPRDRGGPRGPRSSSPGKTRATCCSRWSTPASARKTHDAGHARGARLLAAVHLAAFGAGSSPRIPRRAEPHAPYAPPTRSARRCRRAFHARPSSMPSRSGRRARRVRGGPQPAASAAFMVPALPTRCGRGAARTTCSGRGDGARVPPRHGRTGAGPALAAAARAQVSLARAAGDGALARPGWILGPPPASTAGGWTRWR